MKFSYPDINYVFDTNNSLVNDIIIENQQLLFDLCTDISNQINGSDGKTVVSIDNQLISISKNVELLSQFIPFDINKKMLISKLVNNLEKIAMSPEYYEYTMTELSNIEKYIIEITNELQGDIIYSKLNISSLLKSIGLQFDSKYDSLGESIIDYMELVRQYIQDKLFVIVNLRMFISDKECELFYETVLKKELHVIMIEGMQHTALSKEKTYIIDNELCEIT